MPAKIKTEVRIAPLEGITHVKIGDTDVQLKEGETLILNIYGELSSAIRSKKQGTTEVYRLESI